MKRIKDLVLISGSELVFGSCLPGAVNIKYKEVSMQVMEVIIRLKKK